MPKPVCVNCQCFFRPEKNGFSFIEGKPDGDRGEEPNDNLRGKRRPQAWTPYKLWVADLWKCPDCGFELVIGAGDGPVSEHYRPDFAHRVAQFGATLQVNDC